MRGLRLFVRPIESEDHSSVRTFLDAHVDAPEGHSAGDVFPACGLLGKLLGDIVAVVALKITGDALLIEEVVVARELRRKWIGRVMMREVEQLAAKMERPRIVVDDARDAGEFFRRTGFQREGERWVKAVPQS